MHLNKKVARAIAFYLPQFHPIPENDNWWGKGFTEWTNVAKAIPLFKGHYQPHVPADLGFYDLRLPEAREAQAQLAKEYGIEGFCYWHYWFGSGKRVLERPFNEVLESGKPDFPFCLGWANESWTGIWHGLDKEVLLEQTYPGREDYINHFNFLIKAFKDPRYITVDGKPLFLVYQPLKIPDLKEFTSLFNQLAKENGLPGIHFVATNVPEDWQAAEYGFDAITLSFQSKILYSYGGGRMKRRFRWELTKRPQLLELYKKVVTKPFNTFDFKKAAALFISDYNFTTNYYPCAIPNWDNSPRSGKRGLILTDSTPDLFRSQLKKAVSKVNHLPDSNKIIFIKSWNEWAEGNHLEPDLKFGRQYLEVVREVINQ